MGCVVVEFNFDAWLVGSRFSYTKVAAAAAKVEVHREHNVPFCCCCTIYMCFDIGITACAAFRTGDL